MPILDKISEAEKKAEELKQKARDDVQSLLQQKSQEDAVKVKKIQEETNKEIKNLNTLTLEKAEKIEKDTISEYQKACNKDDVNAKSHRKETVDYIIKKVIDS